MSFVFDTYQKVRKGYKYIVGRGGAANGASWRGGGIRCKPYNYMHEQDSISLM